MNGLMSIAEESRPADAPRRDRTKYLYLAVIVAVLAGILVGLIAPGVGESLKPLGEGFVNLIKMMISPIIFCTIVLGIGSVRQAAKVGKVGGAGARLLPGDVHGGAGDRPGRRERPAPRQRAGPGRR
jgi:aerobic C4-dicarboxylate transport protein